MRTIGGNRRGGNRMSGRDDSIFAGGATGGAERIAEVAAYWDGLRRGQIVPYRSEVDPRGIEGALPAAFVAERVSPGMARFRVTGTEVNEVLGMETRGMPLSALIEPVHRAAFMQGLAHVFDRPAMLRLRLSAPTGIGRPRFTATLLLLPMRDDEGGITRALGCLATEGRVGRPPRRFDIEAAALEPLGPQPLRMGAMGRDDMARRAPAGMAEAQAGYAAARGALGDPRPAPTEGRETMVPYLRVIDGS